MSGVPSRYKHRRDPSNAQQPPSYTEALAALSPTSPSASARTGSDPVLASVLARNGAHGFADAVRAFVLDNAADFHGDSLLAWARNTSSAASPDSIVPVDLSLAEPVTSAVVPTAMVPPATSGRPDVVTSATSTTSSSSASITSSSITTATSALKPAADLSAGASRPLLRTPSSPAAAAAAALADSAAATAAATPYRSTQAVDVDTGQLYRYITITMMTSMADVSLDELRWSDYKAGRRGVVLPDDDPWKSTSVRPTHPDDGITVASVKPSAAVKFRNLEELHVAGSSFMGAPDISMLSSLQRLRMLSFSSCGPVESFPPLPALEILDMSEMALPVLSPTVSLLGRLRILNVSKNKLKALPAALGELAQLEELYAFDNQLTVLPPCLARLSRLIGLNLEKNQLTGLAASALLPSLQHLNAAQNKLRSLPVEIGELTNLLSLTLNVNHLSHLPPSVARMTALHTLRLDRNELTSLPEDLGNLTSLRRLLLASNRLVDLPASLQRLTSLTAVNFAKNALTRVPLLLTKLPGLRYVNIVRNDIREVVLRGDGAGDAVLGPGSGSIQLFNCESNKLTRIDSSITLLQHVQEISLASNSLQELPQALLRLSELRALNLSHNAFQSLSFPSPDDLPQLKTLVVSYNRLSSLTFAPGALSELTELDASRNALLQAPVGLQNLAYLRVINLRNNALSAFPAALLSMSSLVDVVLDNNALHTLPNRMAQLKCQLLSLANNRLTQLPPSLGGASKLRVLNLAKNKLRALPAQLGRLVSLESIDVSSNLLVDLPWQLAQPAYLTSITAQYNKLTSFPPVFSLAPQRDAHPGAETLGAELAVLDLMGNNIAALPLALLRNQRLRISLGFNPLYADPLPPQIRRAPVNGMYRFHRRSGPQSLKALVAEELVSFDAPIDVARLALPADLKEYLSRPEACASCRGPVFEPLDSGVIFSHQWRYRFVPFLVHLCARASCQSWFDARLPQAMLLPGTDPLGPGDESDEEAAVSQAVATDVDVSQLPRGTLHTEYTPTMWTINAEGLLFHSLCAMPQYCHKSHEELRSEDYTDGAVIVYPDSDLSSATAAAVVVPSSGSASRAVPSPPPSPASTGGVDPPHGPNADDSGADGTDTIDSEQDDGTGLDSGGGGVVARPAADPAGAWHALRNRPVALSQHEFIPRH